MQQVQPITQDLVLLGGGHTHAIVLRQLAMAPLPGVRLTLITNLVDTPYSGMLPCHISGLYSFDESHIDLRPLTRFAGCRLVMDRAIGLDLARQQVICDRHPPLAYDWLSIDTGSTPATVAVPGAKDWTIPAKPVPDLLRAWELYVAEIEQGPPGPRALAVVGGGVGGVELTLNMQVRLWQLLERLGRSRQDITLHLFHRGAEIAQGRNRSTRRLLQRRFQSRGVQLHLGESVCGVEPLPGDQRRVRCGSGLTVDCDRVFWVTNAAAPSWVKQSGLATDDQGFVLVQDTLQSCSHPQVFAAGDVATMVNHPRPKAGVFAVRQGPPLTHNLRAAVRGQPLKPFRPQRQYLNIIDTGDGSAIASRGPFTFASPWMRAWKDRIDRRFMALFKDFPTLEPPSAHSVDADPSAHSTPATQAPAPPPMYCAGCGSKLGSDALSRALNRVRAMPPVSNGPPNGPDRAQTKDHGSIVVGLEAPDDAAIAQLPVGTLAVHTVDFFRALVDDPYQFAQICVKHCLSDLYAMGATPQTALAIATVPYGRATLQEETLFHLLAGAQAALGEAHTALVGGHTTAGPELVLGFACNGWVAPDGILPKGGLTPGQRLILTQPLGTGTLFAADMAKRAKGRWIEAAIAEMVRPTGPAAACLQRHGVTACTDVTGFGLLGHLGEMAIAAGVAVSLELQTLPLLPGARQTLAQGMVSTLQPQNLQAARLLSNPGDYARHPDYGILFDPQTAGGLLAAVPEAQAIACLQALQTLGYTAALVGTVEPLAAATPPITIRAW
ncbi:MAG: selenide, water dikinase SelD [Leptolyngbya sp.]|nr:selenide, water dikinase SelD [Leptolyngbya sp.]